MCDLDEFDSLTVKDFDGEKRAQSNHESLTVIPHMCSCYRQRTQQTLVSLLVLPLLYAAVPGTAVAVRTTSTTGEVHSSQLVVQLVLQTGSLG